MGKNTYTMPQECHGKYNDDLEVHVPAPNYQSGPCVVPIFIPHRTPGLYVIKKNHRFGAIERGC